MPTTQTPDASVTGSAGTSGSVTPQERRDSEVSRGQLPMNIFGLPQHPSASQTQAGTDLVPKRLGLDLIPGGKSPETPVSTEASASTSRDSSVEVLPKKWGRFLVGEYIRPRDRLMRDIARRCDRSPGEPIAVGSLAPLYRRVPTPYPSMSSDATTTTGSVSSSENAGQETSSEPEILAITSVSTDTSSPYPRSMSDPSQVSSFMSEATATSTSTIGDAEEIPRGPTRRMSASAFASADDPAGASSNVIPVESGQLGFFARMRNRLSFRSRDKWTPVQPFKKDK